MVDADCTYAFCGWTGLDSECDRTAAGLRCPECGGEVKLFDGPAHDGVSEFAIRAGHPTEAPRE